MTQPIPMILHCPECGKRHVDEGEFATKPHHTHACQHCGLVWRPAIVVTVGVRFLPGFRPETGTEIGKRHPIIENHLCGIVLRPKYNGGPKRICIREAGHKEECSQSERWKPIRFPLHWNSDLHFFVPDDMGQCAVCGDDIGSDNHRKIPQGRMR